MAALMPFLGQERDAASQLLLQVIASILDELIRKGEASRRGNVHRKLTKFHGLRAPSIPLPEYLQRIAQFSGCSNEAFVLMLIYLDRLVTNKDIPLDSLNVHRLVITGTLLAAKFFDDHYLDNSHYSAVGGLPRNEINELELEMLFLLGFNLFVTTDNYNTYFSTLTNMAQSRSIQSPPALAEDARRAAEQQAQAQAQAQQQQQQQLQQQQLQQQLQQQQQAQQLMLQQQQAQVQQQQLFHQHQHQQIEADQWVCVSRPLERTGSQHSVQSYANQQPYEDPFVQVSGRASPQPTGDMFMPPPGFADPAQQAVAQAQAQQLFMMQQQQQQQHMMAAAGGRVSPTPWQFAGPDPFVPVVGYTGPPIGHKPPHPLAHAVQPIGHIMYAPQQQQQPFGPPAMNPAQQLRPPQPGNPPGGPSNQQGRMQSSAAWA